MGRGTNAKQRMYPKHGGVRRKAESQHARQWAGAHTALVTVSAVSDKGGEAMCT